MRRVSDVDFVTILTTPFLERKTLSPESTLRLPSGPPRSAGSINRVDCRDEAEPDRQSDRIESLYDVAGRR